MNLDNIKPRIDQFVEFSRKFPAAYRSAIITYLLQLDAAERGAGAPPTTAPGSTPAKGGSPGKAARATGHVHPAIIEVAAEINVQAETVDRRLVTVTDERPDIRWKSDDVSVARRQVEYALVYTYVLEKMGQEGARVTELRNVCVQKRSYDMPNFLATFRRQRNLLQLADLPGTKEQEIVLTGPGRQRARELLAGAAESLGPTVAPEPASTKRNATRAAVQEDGEITQPELSLDLPAQREEEQQEVT